MTLHLGDCLEVMRTLPDASVDAVVCDPPYGLSFMGRKWDYDVPSVEIWAECLRVLKPGGHLLAFAGTRTQHRMAVRIEDAGFEIRDMLAWVYGSGMPKSLDVSKAIDKCNGETGRLLKFTEWMRTTGLAARQINKITETNMGSHYLTAVSQPAIPTPALWALLRPHCGDVPEWVDQLVQRIEAERGVVGQGWRINRKEGAVNYGSGTPDGTYAITTPATPEAQQWAGWGTALKPALEPITMARKPLEGTVAANVLAHGTGGLNIDGCRVAHAEECRMMAPSQANIDNPSEKHRQAGRREAVLELKPGGRWPANLIHDGSDEVVGLFPQTVSGGGFQQGMIQHSRTYNVAKGVEAERVRDAYERDNGGSAARFFYTAKAAKTERQGVTHPTVKPLDLMAYLCRLVTPPGGTVLDPFMGTGTTIKAALSEGFQAIGIERNPAYFAMAEHRLNGAQLGLGLEVTP
jgi:DNA modification methylase